MRTSHQFPVAWERIEIIHGGLGSLVGDREEERQVLWSMAKMKIVVVGGWLKEGLKLIKSGVKVDLKWYVADIVSASLLIMWWGLGGEEGLLVGDWCWRGKVAVVDGLKTINWIVLK